MNETLCEIPVQENIIYSEEKKEIEYKVEKHENVKEEELNQKGFKNDFFGFIMILYMSAISIFWTIILLVLCLDYYGYVSCFI